MLPSEEIKQRINLVDLVGEFVPLKKAGVNFRAVCPFHQEKTPSFMVSPTKQIWHCFGCGLGGDIFEFVKQIEGVEFPEALQILAGRAGVTLSRPKVNYQQEVDKKKVLYEINDWAAKYYAKVLAESAAAAGAREYLQKRALKAETIQAWQLGYAPDDFHAFENFIVKKGFQRQEAVAAGLLIEKDRSVSDNQGGPASTSQGGPSGFFDRFRGRVMFPIFDLHGRVVGFTGRILQQSGPAPSPAATIAKYVNSPETLIYSKSHVLYGLSFAKTEIRKAGEVIVVEGNMDVITCHEFGFKNVVGSSGTALTESQLSLLKRFTDDISFAFDVDQAGLTATRRAVELALAAGFNVRIIAIPPDLAKDPDELLRRDAHLWEEQVKNAKSFLDFYFEAIFANLNLESSIDKKRAVADFLPLLSILPDPLDRAHYVHKLSQNIGVEERLIADLLNQQILKQKFSGSPAAGKASGPAAYKKSKQELVERRVLGQFLKSVKTWENGWDRLSLEDFTVPQLHEIFAVVAAAGQRQGGEPISVESIKQADEKFSPEIDLLLFGAENELTMAGAEQDPAVLLKQSLDDLKLLTIKRKMQTLAKEISTAERAGDQEQIQTLTALFSNLSRDLIKYDT